MLDGRPETCRQDTYRAWTTHATQHRNLTACACAQASSQDASSPRKDETQRAKHCAHTRIPQCTRPCRRRMLHHPGRNGLPHIARIAKISPLTRCRPHILSKRHPHKRIRQRMEKRWCGWCQLHRLQSNTRQRTQREAWTSPHHSTRHCHRIRVRSPMPSPSRTCKQRTQAYRSLVSFTTERAL
jgi:hypothetical protein